MNRKLEKVMDYFAWFVLGGILLWLILKVSGVINTPEIITYSPVFGAVYLAGWAMNKLNRNVEDVKDIRIDIKDMKKDISGLNYKVKDLDKDIEFLKTHRC